MPEVGDGGYKPPLRWGEVPMCRDIFVGVVCNRALSLILFYLSTLISEWSKFKGVD